MKTEWGKSVKSLAVAAAVAVLAVAAPVGSQAQTDGRLWTLATVQVKNDMIPEFEALEKELNAALKKAGVTERRASQVVRGVTGEYLDSWATLDERHPVRESLGQEKFLELIAGVGAMTSSPDRKVLRLRPDLSIIP